jgi:BirA family transcriptional regulator, biotin operon repressor / biotin---[acetyl-CoA-carboxylase] ligase
MLEPPLGPVHWLDEVASTQDEARHQLPDLGDATIIAARRQTSGRGRQGRSWWHDDQGLAFTYVHRPPAPLSPTMALRIPLLVGLALHTVLQPEQTHLLLKWPNDVLRPRRDGDGEDGALGPWRKVAGILVEGVGVSTAGMDAVLIGVGINLIDPTTSLSGIAGGLRRSGGARREQVLMMVHHSMAAHLPLLAPPLWPTAVQRFRRHCMTLGKTVGGDVPGVAVAIDDEGALVVRDEAGGSHVVRVGDVPVSA